MRPADHAIPARIRQLVPAVPAEDEGRREGASQDRAWIGRVDDGKGGVQVTLEMRRLEMRRARPRESIRSHAFIVASAARCSILPPL